MSESPYVAVAILNWNGLADTRNAVTSVLGQTYPRVACIVADNGSAGSEALVLRQEFPTITVVENGENRGFCGGNNQAAQMAKERGADYLLLLNNDATLAPDAIERLVGAMEADASLGAVSPCIFHQNPSDTVWFGRGLVHLGSHAVVTVSPIVSEELPVSPTDWVCGCALLIRTATFLEQGGFDERFFAYHEDVDLSLNLRRAGLRCGVVPQAHAWHVGSVSTGGVFSAHQLYYAARNSCLLVRRHGSARERFIFWPRFWLRTAAVTYALLLWDRGPERAGAVLHGAICGMRGAGGPWGEHAVGAAAWRARLARCHRIATVAASVLPGMHRRLRSRVEGTYLSSRKATEA